MNSSNIAEYSKQQQQNCCRYWIWITLAAVILLTAGIRIRLLDVPLERDEGEHAYAGQIILQGIAPYAKVYNMAMPGVDAAYALIMAVFGQTVRGIRMGLLVVNIATILVLFLLAKELFGLFTGVCAAAGFAIMSAGPMVQGIYANTEHFVILPSLAGVYFLVRPTRKQGLFSLAASGLLLGLAFIMKQYGAFFIIFSGLYLLSSELRRRPFIWRPFIVRYGTFVAGALLPFAVTCLLLWYFGVFRRFWLFTIYYNLTYVSQVPLSVGLSFLQTEISQITTSAVLLWILVGVGVVGLWMDREKRRHIVLVTGFFVFSFLSVCPGLYFRSHYFILLLPSAALLAGIGFDFVRKILTKNQTALKAGAIATILLAGVLLHAIYQQRNFFFVMSPIEVSREVFGYNPFPESREIARFIKENSEKEDPIAVLGSEPQIYFYSNRHAATGYIYTYTLMEDSSHAVKMQEEMIEEIERACPRFLVYVMIQTSWLSNDTSHKMLFDWFEQYQQKHYHMVGIIDIISSTQTIYRWGQNLIDYTPRSNNWLAVFERKD
jgi:hypothetical protein